MERRHSINASSKRNADGKPDQLQIGMEAMHMGTILNQSVPEHVPHAMNLKESKEN